MSRAHYVFRASSKKNERKDPQQELSCKMTSVVFIVCQLRARKLLCSRKAIVRTMISRFTLFRATISVNIYFLFVLSL